MKKLTVLISIVLLLATLFTGCSEQQTPNENGTTGTTPTAEPVTEDPAPPTEPRTLKIGGVDISQYKIIYALNADKQYVFGVSRNYWSSEYDAELQTAKRLAEMIKTYFGVELETGLDISTEKSDYEILIGATNRSETKTATTAKSLAIDDYEIKLYGTKLVVRGGALGSMYHSLDALENWFEQEVEGRVYALTESNPISGSYRLDRIAFIGDSITDGYNSTNRTYVSYVPTVGRMYWQESVVYNYGLTSTTMRSDLADSYQKSAQWQQLLANTEKYDVVLIMLGTNDSNRVWKETGRQPNNDGWGTADDTAYKNSARQIIDRVKQHSPDTEFVIMNCPAYYASSYFGSVKVRNLQTEIVNTMKAEGYKIHLYDMHSYTSQNLGESMFPDKLHPNDEGHFNMAKGVTEMLRLLKEGKTNQFLLN